MKIVIAGVLVYCGVWAVQGEWKYQGLWGWIIVQLWGATAFSQSEGKH